MTVACERCGRECVGTKGKRYCSTSCRSAATIDRRTVDATCLVCGAAFRQKPNIVGTCSISCGSRLATFRKELAAPGCRCRECGKAFTAKDPRGSRFCSLRCRRRNDCADRRRRLRAADVGDRFTVSLVAARDGTRCALCGGFVDMTLRAPDPMSPSMDHVVALSLGGLHSFANVQLAHLGCNSAKGNGTEGHHG